MEERGEGVGKGKARRGVAREKDKNTSGEASNSEAPPKRRDFNRSALVPSPLCTVKDDARSETRCGTGNSTEPIEHHRSKAVVFNSCKDRLNK